jgi:hypothetical protein
LNIHCAPRVTRRMVRNCSGSVASCLQPDRVFPVDGPGTLLGLSGS